MAICWWWYFCTFPVSFLKCSSGFFEVFFIVVNPVASIAVYYTTFALCGVFGLCWYKYVLDFSVASEVCVDSIHTADVFDAFTGACTYGMTMYPMYVLLLRLLFFLALLGLFRWKFLHSILSMAHDGYLQLVRTSLMCYYSAFTCTGVISPQKW